MNTETRQSAIMTPHHLELALTYTKNEYIKKDIKNFWETVYEVREIAGKNIVQIQLEYTQRTDGTKYFESIRMLINNTMVLYKSTYNPQWYFYPLNISNYKTKENHYKYAPKEIDFKIPKVCKVLNAKHLENMLLFCEQYENNLKRAEDENTNEQEILAERAKLVFDAIKGTRIEKTDKHEFTIDTPIFEVKVSIYGDSIKFLSYKTPNRISIDAYELLSSIKF